jgi:hypothetical protein
MNNSPNQNHLNCHDECIHRIDIIACGFSIQTSYSEFILPNLHLLTFIVFLQLFSGGLFWRQLRFGGNWLHIIFWQIALEGAQIWWELAPHYFPTDWFGGSSDLEGTESTLFSDRLFLEAAQIWRELAPHYFLADCFGNLEGTGSKLFSGGLIWRQLTFGGNWLHIIFRQIVLEAAQIWREMAPQYFPTDCFWRQLKFGGNWLHIIFRRIVLVMWRELAPHFFPAECFGGSSNLAGTGSTLFSGGLFW